MRVVNGQFPSIEQMTGQYAKPAAPVTSESRENSFAAVLSERQRAGLTAESAPENGRIRFSKHASERLTDRNIELSDGQLKRLTEGTHKAGEKGINDSLVIMDELAFIVNVKNNTVITAMDSSEADESVFTNIDGAVIV